jgi:predicted metal-dependent enzyme (double-stranded beta helix superfamily)
MHVDPTPRKGMMPTLTHAPGQAKAASATHVMLRKSRRFLHTLGNNPHRGTSARIAPLAIEQHQGSEHGYVRHIAYSHPKGLYTVVYLVWRPGQASPVHGHKTWCAYRVLQGELRENHFQWDADAGLAHKIGNIDRKPGDIVQAPPGLQHIHQLTNASLAVAISLHVYGVDEASIATGVNHLVTVG